MIEKLKDFKLKYNLKMQYKKQEIAKKIIALELKKAKRHYEIENKYFLGEVYFNTSKELRIFMIKTVNQLANFLDLDTIRLIYEGKFFC